jgi:hypothetical protein
MTATPKHPTADLKYWMYNQPGQQIFRDIDTYYQAILRGLVPNAKPLAAYGRRQAAAATTTPRAIWPGPTARQPYSATAIPMVLKSSSAADTFGGAGAQQVEVHYVDAAGQLVSDILNTAGLTGVPLSVDGRFIQCTHLLKGTSPVGSLSIVDAATELVVYSYVPAGQVRCASSFRFIPEGWKFFLKDIIGGSVSGTASSGDELQMVSTEIDTHTLIEEGIYIPHNGIALQDSSQVYKVNGAFTVSGGQLFGVDYLSGKGSTFTASWSGWLEKI